MNAKTNKFMQVCPASLVPYFNLEGDCPFKEIKILTVDEVIQLIDHQGYDTDCFTRVDIMKTMDAYGELRYGRKIVKHGNLRDGVTTIVIPSCDDCAGCDVKEETTQDKIRRVANSVRDLLIEKNKAYGDSALGGAQVFSQVPASVALSARIDDKLGRIKTSGINDTTEDTVHDLCGYLVLLLIAMEEEGIRAQPRFSGSND